MANTLQFVNTNSGTASSGTMTITNGGAPIPIGSYVEVSVILAGAAPTSITDTQSNAYTLLSTVPSGTFYVAKYATIVTTLIPATTGVWTMTRTAMLTRYMSVQWVGNPGFSSIAAGLANGMIQTQTATGTGTTYATPALSPNFVDSLCTTLVADAGAATSTPPTSWTENKDVVVSAAVLHVEDAEIVLVASALQSASGTLATSQAWQQITVIIALHPMVIVTPIVAATTTVVTGSSTTIVKTLTVAAAVGDLVLACWADQSSGPSISTMADSVGNTWTRQQTTVPGGTGTYNEWWECRVTIPMPVGATITHTNGSFSDTWKIMDVFKVVAQSYTFVSSAPTAGASSTGTAASSGTSTVLPTACTVGFVLITAMAGTTTTAGPGWTERSDGTDGGLNESMETQYLNGSISTTAAITGQGTLAASEAWTASAIFYSVVPFNPIPAFMPTFSRRTAFQGNQIARRDMATH